MFAISRKELISTFGSPLALIFIGTFLLITLFTFFWVEGFFARGIADLRPLFRWMPLLLVFLVAALTMRQWSEEQRSGTLEILLTWPIKPWKLVMGKFWATLFLVALALALTIGLPITVFVLGNLDWGPVIGGYLAALLLAAAYIAMGLFVSSRTDNQIVALILTALLGGFFYLLGRSGLLGFVGSGFDDIFRALGTSSRFESIERGVVDLRDLVYYLSLTIFFLVLNIFSLDRKRWGKGNNTLAYRSNRSLGVLLIILNLILLNLWLFPLQGLRADITQNRQYSLSKTTKDLLATLEEPILIRGYISEKTHPLLAPLIPQVSDMLREYEIIGSGKVTAEVVDPQKDPDLEAEANQSYGIQPRPFQISSRYEASLVNAYFDILIRYGDQSEVLSFDELIEIVPTQSGIPDINLRNIEYDLTRTVKKVAYGFQSIDAVLASLSKPAKFSIVTTPDSLPESLAAGLETFEKVAKELSEEVSDKFIVETVNPQTSSTLTPQKLFDDYGIQAVSTSLFSDESFYLHGLLEVGEEVQVLYPSNDMSEANVRNALEASLKRASPGFLKVVGFWVPPSTPTQNAFGQTQQPLFGAANVREQLSLDYEVRDADLSEGQVPSDIDILLVLSPKSMTDKERYAIDQFLMRGGAVVVAAGNYNIAPDPFGANIVLEPAPENLKDMLKHYGVTIANSLVMDTQNAPFPIITTRQSGPFQVQEVQAVDYPFFVSVLPNGMAKGHPTTASLPAVMLTYASPLELSEDLGENLEATVLLESSSESWLRTSTELQPQFELYPGLGFPIEGDQQSYPLAVVMHGQFESFFKDKHSPLAETEEPSEEAAAEDFNLEEPEETSLDLGTIEKSLDSARLVVVGSSEFINDIVLRLASQLGQDRSLNNLQFLQNTVDWSVEDADLLSIRSRGVHTRVLKPLKKEAWSLGPYTFNEQQIWEFGNYALAVLALIVIATFWKASKLRQRPLFKHDSSKLGGEA